MPDNQIDILIKMVADVKGGTLTREEIEKVKAASAAAGKESVNASTKATEATRKWKDGVRGLAIEYPVLGRIAAMALNPIAIGVAAVTAAISKSKQITREWETQLQTSAQAAAGPIQTVAQQFREMESERTKANEAFAASLQNIQTFADAAVSKFQAIKTAIGEAIDAQEKFELADVERTIAAEVKAAGKDEKLKAEIKAAGEAEKADLRFSFAARRTMNAEAAEAAINQRREQQLGELDSEAAKQRDIFAGLAKGRSRDAIAAELSDGGASLAARKAAEEKQVAELRAAVLGSPGLPGSLRQAIESGSLGDIESARRTSMSLMPGGNAQIEALVSAMQALQKTEGAQGDFARRRPAMEMAVAAYSAMQSAVTRRDTLEGEIVRSRDVSRATAPFRTEAAIADAATHAAGRGQGDAARLVLGAASGADAVRGGGKATAEQADMIRALTQMLGLQGQNQQTILQMFSRMNDNLANFEKSLKNVDSRLRTHANVP